MPDITKLSPEEQDRLVEKLMSQDGGGSLLTQAQLNGIIDPPNIRHYRKACKVFVSFDQDTLMLKSKAMTLSTMDKPVLVLGESGTGKELIANILHGERRGFLVSVNVCAVTDTLFESELFGHARGSFTGADREREGLIKHADGGTLFLDEIGDMPLQLQAKLLRAINNKTYRMVGSNVDMAMKCRVIAATHRDLDSMVRAGTFRLDLLQRLQVFKLKIKPLRERLCDIPIHVGEAFTRELALMMDEGSQLSGNVRQLLNLKERYDTFGASEITKEDLL